MLKELEVLSEAGDMTTGFFKIKVLMFVESKFNHSAKTESEGKQRQDFGILNCIVTKEKAGGNI